MTELPPRDPDQLASDVFDGLLPPDEAARLRDDPEIADRLARMEAMRGAVRSVPPASPGAADRMISAAVAAALAEGTPGAPGAPPPLRSVSPTGPVPPPPPRYATRAPQRSAGPWLAAAAAVLLVLGFVAVGLSSSSSDDEDQASSDSSGDAMEESAPEEPMSSADAGAEPSDTEDEDGSGGSASPQGEGDVGSGGGSGDTETTQSPDGPLGPSTATAGYLGTFDTPEALTDAVTDTLTRVTTDEGDPPPADTGPPSSDLGTCADSWPSGQPVPGEVTFRSSAVYQGAPVNVLIYDDGSEQRLVATDSSCRVVVDEPYPG